MSETPLRSEKTLRQAGSAPIHVRPYTLVATKDDDVRSLSVSSKESSYTIGRDPDVDLILPGAAVSRRHLSLRLTEELTVEDLDSSNGTLLNSLPMTPGTRYPLRPGDQLQIGDWFLLLQAPFRRKEGVTRWPHGFFLARVDEELHRVGTLGRATFMRIDLEKKHVERTCDALSAHFGGDILLGEYGPEGLELFIRALDSTQTNNIRIDRLIQYLDQEGLADSVGTAYYPQDGATAAELLSKASAALRGDGQPDEVGDGRPVIADPRMVSLYKLIDRVAKSQISVILSGETGVGKEVVAEAIHRRSRRADGPFVRLNCAALSESLLESELFGHEKGAFTGAVNRKTGLIEAADGGTVFLDEVGEMLPSAQVKLLRVLEERKVIRVGGVTAQSVDVRFVSATHRDLPALVESGDFREDLYFRLSGIVLEVPPLRERQQEIGPLAEVFIDIYARRDGVPRPQLSEAGLDHLRAYEWPGNIRELRNVIERAVILCTSGTIEPADVPLEVGWSSRRRTSASAAPSRSPKTSDSGQSLADDIQALEKNRIIKALEKSGGNQSSAAEVLGISRRTLMKRMDQFGIPRPRKG